MTATKQLTVADVFREMRQQFRLTERKIDSPLGVTALTVNRWENGCRQPSPMAMKLIELQL